MSREIVYDKVWFPDAGFTVKRHVDYKWNEDKHLRQLNEYIDTTYTAHYGEDSIQATEVIVDAGHGLGFMVGNIIKYAKRYGKKDGYNKKDIQKILHYGIMLLEIHEREHKS